MPSNDDLLRIARRQNDEIDSLVARFADEVAGAVDRAKIILTTHLSRRIAVEDGVRIARTPGNMQALRQIARNWETALDSQGYARLVERFTGQFAGQFRYFDEVLSLLGLPAASWTRADEALFAAQRLSSAASIESVATTVAQAAQRRALVSVGGLRLTQLTGLLAEEFGKTTKQAESLADTSMTVFYRSITERGFQKIEEDGTTLRYKYYGPDDKLTRPFCDRIVGRSFTRPQIDAMSNGQLPNVFLTGGGYRCRHQWILDVTQS